MATTPPSAALVGPGTELGGRYRLIHSIGRGSSATVFEAEDTSLERRVAVKVLHQQLSNDQTFLDSFAKEARSAASLSHSNIMSVHDWGEDGTDGDGIPFLVSELLEGGSLRDMLDDGAVCSPSQVIAFGIDACRALHYAHGQELVHRDITPANLMFTSDGTLKVADFGLARALADSGWTEPGKTLVGTARYSSPEQAQGKRLTPASDVYSLGLILIEALSGSAPFSADTLLGTLTARVESDVEIPADIPEKLREVLQKMTQRNPEDRPSSHDAGVGLLGAAKGMPRPAELPLVGLPEVDDSVIEEVFEPSSRESSTPGLIAGTRTTGPDDDIAVVRDPDADPDQTMVDVADRTTISEVPIVENGDEPARRWPVLLVAIGIVAAVGWFAWQQVSGANATVAVIPDVAGMTVEDALAELGTTWELAEKLERDPDVVQGSVIRTEPVAGEQLESGAELSYWVSLGLPLVRVPQDDLIGRSQAQAVATLDSIGLVAGDVEVVNSEEVVEGNVISVSVDSLELPLGGTVDLIVSLGPQGRVIPQVDENTDAEQLVLDLQAAGLLVTQLDEFDDEVEVGRLVSVSPAPGTSIERGEEVEVIVSLGPTPVAIPNTSGLSLTETLDLLDGAGFLSELVGPGGQDGGQFASCAVVGTDPPSPTELQPGNVVQILMSDCT